MVFVEFLLNEHANRPRRELLEYSRCTERDNKINNIMVANNDVVGKAAVHR